MKLVKKLRYALFDFIACDPHEAVPNLCVTPWVPKSAGVEWSLILYSEFFGFSHLALPEQAW